MLYRSSDIYGSRIAFKLKNDKGEIYPVSYKEFKQDIVQLGTYLIELGFLGKRIAVIGKNSYQWAVSYFAKLDFFSKSKEIIQISWLVKLDFFSKIPFKFLVSPRTQTLSEIFKK